MQRGITELSDKFGSGGSAGVAPGDDSLRELASGVGQLVNQMRNEQNELRRWVDEQAVQNQEVAVLLKELSARLGGKRL